MRFVSDVSENGLPQRWIRDVFHTVKDKNQALRLPNSSQRTKAASSSVSISP